MAHQLVVTSAIGITLFIVAYLFCYLPRRGKTFAFDVSGQYGAFEQHAKRYQELAKLILTLSTASIAFLVNFLVNFRQTPTSEESTASGWKMHLRGS
jgi:hypothetical protein